MSVNSYKTKKGVRYRYKFNYLKKEYQKGGFLTSKDAKKNEGLHRSKVDNQKNGDILFNDLVDVYILDCASRLRSSTLMHKKKILSKRIVGCIPNKKIRDITNLDLRNFQNTLINDGLKGTYVRNVYSNLSTLLNFGVNFYGLEKNNCSILGNIGSAKRCKKDESFWTLEEYNDYIVHFDNEMIRLAITTLFFTGLRIGELRCLTWQDFCDGSLIVNKTISVCETGEIINKPKTKSSERIVTLPSHVNDLILSWKEKQFEPKSDDRIFYFVRNAIAKKIKKLADLGLVKKIRVHDLRHSHASLLIMMGVNILEVSQRLGHEKIQTTIDTYAHLYPNSQKKLAEEITKFIK
jgi:integrase